MFTTEGKRRKRKKRPSEKERFIPKCPFWKDAWDRKGGPMKDKRDKRREQKERRRWEYDEEDC